jgi:hypothetical protein
VERRVWPRLKPPSEVCRGNEWGGGEGSDGRMSAGNSVDKLDKACDLELRL